MLKQAVVGYERSVWERLEKEKRARQARELAELNGSQYPEDDDPPSPSRDRPPGVEAESQEKAERIKLVLRGEWGEKRLGAEKTVTVGVMLRYYCKEMGKSAEEAKKLKMRFDGETIGHETTVGETEVENGDILEIVCP